MILAPADLTALAHSRMVAPVVMTSSVMMIFLPRIFAECFGFTIKAPDTFSLRSALFSFVCVPVKRVRVIPLKSGCALRMPEIPSAMKSLWL